MITPIGLPSRRSGTPKWVRKPPNLCASLKLQSGCVSRLNVHLPRLDKFTLDHLAATPIAPVIAAANPEARTKIVKSVMKQLQRYADIDGVTYPEETRVLTAKVL
jgi:hypothetical protein